jgi:hypothetical protein
MADQVRINGNIYAHGSIVFKINGERYGGFKDISFGDKRERVRVPGMNKAHKSRGVTSGKYSCDETKVKGPISSCQAVREALAKLAPDGVSYGSVSVPIVVQWVEENSNQTPHTVELNDNYITAFATAHSESADNDDEEMTINTDHIIRDGLTLFDASEGIV